MRIVADALLVSLIAAATLSGCQSGSVEGESERETELEAALTWQEAKATTQARELEIAELIPKEIVIGIFQREKGTLLSCDEVRHSWNGKTTVKLEPGTEIEPLVKAVEEHYAGSQFKTSSRLDILGDYEAAISSTDTAELYLVSREDQNAIGISSGSACFTLPEGVYPGGEF